MTDAVALDAAQAAAAAAGASSGLDLLILHGSRARGDARPGADWDFGYLAEETSDVPGLLAALVETLGDDNVDLVDLDQASGLLRFRSACDGVLAYESESGAFDRYRLEAASFWCENSAMFERGYAATLEAPSLPALDRAVLAERVMTVERHLKRVADRLPSSPDGLRPATDESDAVVLHLWQATQIVIDQAMSACVTLGLGTPRSYADAFRRLEDEGIVATDLADRLVRAAGFRNLVAHGYESLDLARVHEAATTGPADLRQFLACLSRHAEG